LGIVLTACSPGHLGSNEIAFLRNGQLWTIDPSGANAFRVVTQNSPIVGYSWSPNHQLFVFRTLDDQFAKTSSAKHLPTNSLTGQVVDAPTIINTISIDGGTPIPIMLSNTNVQYSNPYWNTSGTRLVYRQESITSSAVPGGALWWVSQNDQPEGIAIKHLPPSYSMPSLSYTSSTAIENFQDGLFTSTLDGTTTHYLLSGTLPGHPLPATLERVLWQPAHPHPLILYAISSSTSHLPSFTANTPQPIQLVALSQDGQRSTLATCTCTQFAWSPDGKYILYQTHTAYTLLNVETHISRIINAEQTSVPYWSPDSHFLLFDGQHQLQLVNIATTNHQTLLTDEGASSTSSTTSQANIPSLVQPVPNSIWASDSTHFLVLTRNRLHWQSKQLSQGLYTVAIDSHGQARSSPSLVDSNNDTQVGWTNQDPNTSFLY
jgi:hypothetical protein